MHAQLLILGIKGTQLTPEEINLFTKHQPAGYILFSRNIETPQQTRALTDQLRELSIETPIICIDNEGGRVWRTSGIGLTPPSAWELANHPDLKKRPYWISEHAIQTAEQLRLLGINFNLGPVLEISYDEGLDNAMSGRCWGTNAQDVITNAGMFNRWLRKKSVLSCGKHFPNCSLGKSDPHHGLPVIDLDKEELLKEDLLPFTALEPELDAIMVAHNAFPKLNPEQPELPATLSHNIITKLLRHQLGFDKLLITDDLDMGAIVNTYGRGPDAKMAIEAGNDLALICHATDSIDLAISALSELSHSQIDPSFERIEKARKKLHGPLTLSDSSWEKNQSAIGQLREITPEISSLKSSPVQDY